MIMKDNYLGKGFPEKEIEVTRTDNGSDLLITNTRHKFRYDYIHRYTR